MARKRGRWGDPAPTRASWTTCWATTAAVRGTPGRFLTAARNWGGRAFRTVTGRAADREAASV